MIGYFIKNPVVELEKVDDTTTRYPEWIPFDCANARFMHTPVESRLPPPVIVGNKTIVFGKALHRTK